MNNRFKIKTITLSLFLTLILVTGTFASIFTSSSSFMIEAQTQPYPDGIDYNNYEPTEYPSSYQPDYFKPDYQSSYAEKDDYKSTKDNTASINKIKCINDNININGVNTGDVNLGNKGTLVAEEGDLSANSFGQNGERYDDENYDVFYKKDKKDFDCLINNDNDNVQVTPSPIDATETLTVIKDIRCEVDSQICEQNNNNNIFQPSNFTILVEGNNPSQTSFPGSSPHGTNVELEPGPYNVTEQGLDSTTPEICNIMGFEAGKDLGNNLFVCTNFSDECEGDVTLGIPQTCTIENVLVEQIVVGNNVYVVWEESESGEIFVTTSTNNGQTFSTPLNISNSPEIASSNPSLIVSENNVYVVWTELANTFLAQSTDNALTFSPPEQVSNKPQVYVVAYFSGEILFTNSIDGSQEFNFPPKVISDIDTFAENPSIAVSGNNVYVVWQDDSNEIFLAISKDGGIKFEDPKNISNTPGSTGNEASRNPKIAVSGSNIYIAWEEGISGIAIASSTNSGQSFSTKTLDMYENASANNPSISASGDNVYVVWDESSDILFSKSSNAGQNFDSPKPVSLTGTFPDIAVSGSKVYITWKDFSQGNPDDILLAKSTDNGQNFNDIDNISGNTGLPDPPQIAAQGDNIFIVWNQRPQGSTSSSDEEIYFASSKNAGESYSFIKNLSNTPNHSSQDPKIAVFGNSVSIIWEEYNSPIEVFMTTSTNTGDIFSVPKKISLVVDNNSLLGDIAVGSPPAPIKTPIINPNEYTQETWINPNYQPSAVTDVEKVTLYCSGDNCASSINSGQNAIKIIEVSGHGPVNACISNPTDIPCTYESIDGVITSISFPFPIFADNNFIVDVPNDSQISGTIIFPRDIGAGLEGYYNIILTFDGTTLKFSADNGLDCDAIFDCVLNRGTVDNLILENRVKHTNPKVIVKTNVIYDNIDLNRLPPTVTAPQAHDFWIAVNSDVCRTDVDRDIQSCTSISQAKSGNENGETYELSHDILSTTQTIASSYTLFFSTDNNQCKIKIPGFGGSGSFICKYDNNFEYLISFSGECTKPQVEVDKLYACNIKIDDTKGPQI